MSKDWKSILRTKKIKKYLLAVIMALTIISCTVGNERSGDPTERGLSYVAGAIVTSAVIRAFFND